jgi:hypothetical protein
MLFAQKPTHRACTAPGSSPTRNPTKLACLGRVLAGWDVLASDPVTHFTIRLRQQSHHNVPPFYPHAIAGVVIDVLADLELAHGLLEPALAILRPLQGSSKTAAHKGWQVRVDMLTERAS